jgi:hypothetical protein
METKKSVHRKSLSVHGSRSKRESLYKSVYQKTSPKKFSLFNPSTWLPTRNNKTAYVYITLHGVYEFQFNNPEKIPKNLSDLPSERYLEPMETFTLNETGIKTLKWMRAVPGAVCNFADSYEIDENYSKLKSMIAANEENLTLYHQEYSNLNDEFGRDFYSTKQKHNEVLYFTNEDEIINKQFVVSLEETQKNLTNKDFKIWFMNNETNITNQVLNADGNTRYGYLKELLIWLAYHNFKHVVLIDLSCSAVAVGDDILSGLSEGSYHTKAAAKEVNTHGGFALYKNKNKNKKYNNKSRRRKKAKNICRNICKTYKLKHKH